MMKTGYLGRFFISDKGRRSVMKPEEYIKNGNPVKAKEALMTLVRNDPANLEHRIFLFQLCCILGEYDRALNQLTVIGEMSDKALAMVQTYRELLQCEKLRLAVFKGEKSPLIFGEPESWIGELVESLKLHGQGKIDEAQALRLSAYNKLEPISGTVNDEPFEWVADADSRIGPLFEVIINGKYYWIPSNRISKIKVEKPEDLRDFVWIPAQFTWVNEGQTVGFIPVRYPESESADEVHIQLAKKTEWLQWLDDVYVGFGQRMFATEANDYALLDIREINFGAIDS